MLLVWLFREIATSHQQCWCGFFEKEPPPKVIPYTGALKMNPILLPEGWLIAHQHRGLAGRAANFAKTSASTGTASAGQKPTLIQADLARSRSSRAWNRGGIADSAPEGRKRARLRLQVLPHNRMPAGPDARQILDRWEPISADGNWLLLGTENPFQKANSRPVGINSS